MLNETERLLNIEKEKYNQLQRVCAPWPVKKQKSTSFISACSCSKSNVPTETTIKEIDSSIVNSIPKIVNKTKALRINPSKNEITKYIDAKNSIKEVITSKSKFESVPNNNSKTISKPLKFGKSSNPVIATTSKCKSIDSAVSHSPSCVLYSSEISKTTMKTESYSNLSDAINAYGVPQTLQKTLNNYYKFVLESNTFDNITKKSRLAFMKRINERVMKQNFGLNFSISSP